MKKKEKNKKTAFTLIELLAVIIILGILMIIAVPAVTKYIDDSRKNGYVSTAKELAGGARSLIHSGSLNLTDKDTTYYIDSKCIESSNGAKTPYGELTKAYVVVNYTDEGYDYYWISVDDAGVGVKKITNLEELDTDSIERDITEEDILNNLGVDARHNYVIINEENGCGIGTTSEALVRVDSSGNTDVVDYPVGKTKRTLSFGDIVKIGNQEFYFLSYKGNDTILMTRYNLKVGVDVQIEKISENRYSSTIINTYSTSDPGYGLQDSECTGKSEEELIVKCAIDFSNTNYWAGQLGEGKKYPDKYVYDSNSLLYQHIENYKTYLESLGVNIKEARAKKDDDSVKVTKEGDTLINTYAVPILCSTTYWEGDATNDTQVSFTMRPNMFGRATYSSKSLAGIRPVIVI